MTIKELIRKGIKTPADLARTKREIAKKYKVALTSNVQLLKAYHDLVKNKRLKPHHPLLKRIETLLRIRKVRSLSGIVVVSVLTKPYPCPGKCLYCPFQKGIPKSYLASEPAVQRAILNKFNPYLQVENRIKALENTGHPTDKIELRIIGGTWSYYPKKYQTWFIKECFRAANEKMLPIKKPRQNKRFQLMRELLKEQKKNEKAKQRIVGITIETRPDFINEKEIKRLRKLGVTRVELGVQSIYDDILEKNKRGHGVKATILATKFLKDAGFKICYQMMPNLPGSSLKRDEKMFKELFSNPNFQPDLLKIYPLALLKEAPLYKIWKAKKFKPYSFSQLKNLLEKIKKNVPYYVRIQRLIRDIPSSKVLAGGAKVSNLRQILAKEMKEKAKKCKCIRCREVREDYNLKEKLYLFRQDYQASGGKEIFLTFENKKRERLYSLLRLRIPSQYFETRFYNKTGFHRVFPVLKKAAIIREVHTYGQLVPISEKEIAPQHRGLGKKLIKEAEKIAKKEFGLKKMAVISGVGVRPYYRKLGYRLKETYMVKSL